MSVCVHQRCSRTGRVQKNHKGKDTIFNEHPVPVIVFIVTFCPASSTFISILSDLAHILLYFFRREVSFADDLVRPFAFFCACLYLQYDKSRIMQTNSFCVCSLPVSFVFFSQGNYPGFLGIFAMDFHRRSIEDEM